MVGERFMSRGRRRILAIVMIGTRTAREGKKIFSGL
jgi:hypothetical protein